MIKIWKYGKNAYIDSMKKCNKCNLEKDFSEFRKASKHKDGYRYSCKECESGHKIHKPIIEGLKICTTCNIEQPLENYSRAISKGKEYKQSSCKTCRNKKKALKRLEEPEKEALRKRKQKLKYSYDMTIEDYDKMYLNQQGLCKICNNSFDKLNIDHCHINGNVRGLLCTGCNLGLGSFKDNEQSLNSAIFYLRNSKLKINLSDY